MANCIDRDMAIAIIEEKQKELCPVGRYGRSYVYGSDREKYDAWDEIIDALENAPSADVAPVVHGRCPICSGRKILTQDCYNDYSVEVDAEQGEMSIWQGDACLTVISIDYCPNCGAKMDGGTDDES